LTAARPNNSFKPNPLRYTNNMAGKACHVVGSTTQVGLTQALGRSRSNLGISYMLKILSRHVPKRAIWLVSLTVAFFAIWHERGAISDIAQQAFETDASLDAQDANQK